jgi:iron complex outermembrane receptor protein
MRGLVATLLAIELASRALAAQAPARLTGRVTDAATGAPLADAELLLGDLRQVSGSDGGFAFGSVTPGRLTLLVRHIGYAPWRSAVDVVPGLERSLNITLVPQPLRLDSITVVAAAPGGISIAGEELVRRGGDLARALDGWEGVVVRRTGSAGPAAPQVRGGGPDEVLVLVDGVAINDPLTGRADLSLVPSREVRRVTLVPGAQTVRVGSRAVAGVIVVDTRRELRPEATMWGGSHSARGVRLGASPGRAALSAGVERFAEDFPYDVPEVRGGGQGRRDNAGGTLYTGSARVPGPVELTLRGALSDRGLPGTTTNPTPSARASDRSVQLGLRREGAAHALGSLVWLETRARDPAPPTGAPYDAYTHGVEGTLELGYRARPSLRGWRGDAGVALEARGDRFAGDGVRPGSSFTQLSLQADASLQRGSASLWTLAPALRVEGWTGQTHPRLSARVDAGWRQGSTDLTLALGSAVTPPVLSDLLFREGVGVRLNPDLRPERVRWEIEAGVRHEVGRGGVVALRLFTGRVADMVLWAPDFRFVWSPRNFDVRRRGGEVTVGLRPAPTLRLDGSAGYSAVTYDIPDGAQVQYRPRVTYAASLSWRPGAWGADLRWHRVGARYPNSAGTNPRPAFDLVDLGIERRIAPPITLRGELHDLTDTRAEFIAVYPTPGRSFTLNLDLALP